MPPNLSMGIISNDLLNTTALTLGIDYNFNEDVIGYSFNTSYGGFYPILDFGLRLGDRTKTYEEKNGENQTDVWEETSASLGFRIPLDLSVGIHYTKLQLSAATAYTKISNQDFKLQQVYLI